MIMEVLTAILVFVTGLYVYWTYKMANISERSVQIMKDQTEAMFRPYLVIQPIVKYHTRIFYLKIYNSGKIPALNVKLELDKDFYQFNESDKNLKETNAFTLEFDSFVPNQELFFALGQSWLIFGELKNKFPQQFVVTATYSYMNKTVVEKNHIDLRPFLGSDVEINPIVDELEKIRKAQELLAKKPNK